MRVRFTKTRVVKAANGETFEADKEYELSDASAQRWIRRGVAVAVEKSIDEPPKNKAVKASAKTKAE